MFNLFGKNSPLLAAPDFVGWVERSDTHQIPGGQQMMGIAALNPSYTSNTTQLAAGYFITQCPLTS
ncbi:MAG: hypothetical protein KKH12_00970 [Gammaproteobacteria bacterium]|nr:hypothetical protein [Gammaproteobacteria bacterium]MBU1480226.1 hypothetical protein [Gammaproteobacteria bacterium]